MKKVFMSIILSIVVPVYNCENTIERTFKSIEPQLNEESEMIFINDGSEDNSLNKINKLINASNKNIKVISKDNGGLISAREAGIKEASGDFICNVDGGDGLEDNAINNILKSINNHKDVDYFVMDCKTNDKNGTHQLIYDKKYVSYVRYLLLGQCPFSICFKIVRRNLLLDSNVYKKCKDVTSGEDLCFSFDLMNKTNKGLKLENTYYIYNLEHNSMSSENKTDINFLKALDYVKNEIKVNNYDLNDEFDYLVFKKTVMNIILNNNHSNYKTLYDYYKKSNIKPNNKYIKMQSLCTLLAKIKVAIYG